VLRRVYRPAKRRLQFAAAIPWNSCKLLAIHSFSQARPRNPFTSFSIFVGHDPSLWIFGNPWRQSLIFRLASTIVKLYCQLKLAKHNCGILLSTRNGHFAIFIWEMDVLQIWKMANENIHY